MTVEDGGAPQGPSNPVVDGPSAAGSQATEQHIDLRDLAAALYKEPPVSASIIKGTVTAVALTAAPPSITVQVSGDASVDIPGVRFIDSYSPVVGDTVLLVKQGSQFFVLGQMNSTTATPAENGWVTPSLGSNVTTHGVDPVRYRVVVRDGDRVVQLRGGVTLTSTPTALWTMPAGVRPVVDLLPLLIARNTNGNSNVAQLQVNANGTMVLAGATTGVGSVGGTSGNSSITLTAASNSFNTGSSSPGTSTNGEHRHWVFTTGDFSDYNGPHSHTVNSHSHSVGAHDHGMAHTHPITTAAPAHPTMLSFNGVEYIL